jgi:hypothetical protein
MLRTDVRLESLAESVALGYGNCDVMIRACSPFRPMMRPWLASARRRPR